ncbi:Protein transport protein Sec16A, partial [Ceratobasidium sp. 392]
MTQTQTKTYTPNAYAPPTSYTSQTTQSSYGSAYAPPPPISSASGPYAPPATNAYTPQTNKYAPPPTTNAYAPPANTYTPSTNAYTPSANAYTPSTNSYTPSTNTYTPSMNSYTPSTNAYAPPAKPYARPPPPAGSFIPPPPTAYANPAPPPPAPSGIEHLKYRSASANAYDPPIPASRRRIDSSASSVSAGTPSLVGPFGQSSFSPAQPTYGQLGHGAPPAPPPPGPPQGRNRVGSQGSVLSGGVPQRTLSPADALAPGRIGSPLAGPGRVGSPLVRTASAYDPPAPAVAAGSTVSPTAGPGVAAHPPPAPPKQAYGPPPATGTKSSFDPPPPRTGTKSAFDPPLTGRKSAFDPPLTGRKNAFDPPLTGRKNAFDPPMPRTGTKSAFDPPPPRLPPMTPNLGTTPPTFAPPPRPKSAYDPPPARPDSGAGSGRYAPGLDMSSASAVIGPRSAPEESRGSVEMDGRGSLDGADSGYKSRTSMSSERAWTEDDPEGGSTGPRIEESGDPEGGTGDYDEAADRTVVAPLLGVAGPRITATAPTPLASPGKVNVEFGEEDPEGGESAYVPPVPARTASPAVMSRTASPAVRPPPRMASPAVPLPPRAASPAVSATTSPIVPPPNARTMSRTTSVSSTNDSPYGHKVSPSLSKRPAPVVVEPPQATNKYTIDTQPYTPMYGQSPYSDVQTSPPKKQTSVDPYAPTNKPADPYAPMHNKPTTDPYAPANKPADPYAPPKATEPHPPSKFTGEPTQRVTYSPPNGLSRVYTPPPARNGALGSRQSSMASVKDAYAPPKDPYAPPAPSKDPYAPPSKDPCALSTNADPYAPSKTAPRDIKRPASTAYDPPMPAVPQQPHAASYTPGMPSQMYTPRRDSRTQDQGDISDYEGSGGYVSRYNYSSVDPYQPSGTPAAYVPPPSGVDPLGRHDSRAPIIAFGFGGRIVTSFPGLSELTGGFDVSLGRKAAPIQVRTLHKVIPESAVENSTAVFPGPLFSDPGSPTKSLVSGSSAKTKKAAVVKYLAERAEEIERGLGYLAVETGTTPGPSERSKAEGKLVIVSLLKIMVENDGKLSGTPAIDAAVRHALVPRLASAPTITSPNSQAATFTLASALDVTAGPSSSHSNANDSPVATYKLKPAALDKIQEFLLQGERRAAYHYALDERMWAHAMLISSSLDKEAWKEVVNEFIRAELGVRTDQKKPAPFGGDPSVANGREPLRVAYSLFAGQGAAAVQELLPPKNLAKTGMDSLMPPTMPMMHATPISPNFPQPVLTSNLPTPALLQWQEIVATIISNQGDSSALTALGDYLISNKWTEAAHVCYLLSPATSPVGGLSTPSVRMVLLGSESPSVSRNFEKDDDAIIFTEIAEYAHSLLPT